MSAEVMEQRMENTEDCGDVNHLMLKPNSQDGRYLCLPTVVFHCRRGQEAHVIIHTRCNNTLLLSRTAATLFFNEISAVLT